MKNYILHITDCFLLNYILLIAIPVALLLPLGDITAATTDHAVISEIKLTGGTGKTTDEFVELYNPTDQTVDLTGWTLVKKTASGNSYVLVNDFSGQSIAPYSYFLVSHPIGYFGSVAADWHYDTSNSVSDNNTVMLIDDQGNTVDMVGFGSAGEYEGEAISNPGANKSAERKAFADSTAELMIDGGAHYFAGNSEDSSNNAADFIIRDPFEPQNSQSEAEYPDVPSVNQTPPPNNNTPVSSQHTPQGYSDSVYITELYPNPPGRDDGEFIELYNASSQPIDLSSWQLGDESSRRYTFPHGTTVNAYAYYAVAKDDSGISLNNSGDTAFLYQPDGTLLDKISYGTSHEAQSYSLVNGVWAWTDGVTPRAQNELYIANEAPEAVITLEDKEIKVEMIIQFDASESSDPDGDDLEYYWEFGDGATSSEQKLEHTFTAAGEFTVTLTVTDEKGGEAEDSIIIVVTDYDYSTALLITEVLPSCSPSDKECEFIELYNPENREIDLTGWQLSDETINFVFENIVISADGYLAIGRGKSRITLNNSGDKIFLIDPAGTIINGVTYGKASKDSSFSREGKGRRWFWTEEVTPGEENVIIGGDELQELQAEGGTGEEIIEEQEVLEITISDITEEYLGRTLIVTGEVEKANSRGIYIMDNMGTVLRAYIQAKTDITQPKLEPGDMVTITGVLDKTSAGFRLLPRNAEDIVIHPKKGNDTNEGTVLGASTAQAPEADVITFPENNAKQQTSKYIIGAVSVILAIIIGLMARYMWHRRNHTSISVD